MTHVLDTVANTCHSLPSSNKAVGEISQATFRCEVFAVCGMHTKLRS